MKEKVQIRSGSELFCKLRDLFKGNVAQVVFDLAGIPFGGLFINTDPDQKRGEGLVPVVDLFGYVPSVFCQGDEIVPVHFYVAVFAKPFHGYADAGF